MPTDEGFQPITRSRPRLIAVISQWPSSSVRNKVLEKRTQTMTFGNPRDRNRQPIHDALRQRDTGVYSALERLASGRG